MAWRVVGDSLEPAWTRTDLVVAGCRLRHLAITSDQVVTADDTGVMRIFARDGTPVRVLRSGSPLLAAPLLVGGMMVVVLAPGVVAAF